MKKNLAISFVTLFFFNLVTAQKRSTVLGDAWTGEVVATSNTTREITIKYDGKGNIETFTGVLIEGYKMKMKDGSFHELNLSEIPVGSRVRVFAKSKEQASGGTKVKIHLISRIDFLGKDEYARLREQLNLSASVPVTLVESKELPASSPLKIYLAIEDQRISESFIEWVNEWNKDNGAKHGSLEVVSNLADANVYLVRYSGSKLLVDIVPTATAFLAVPKNDGLEVIWKQAFVINSDQVTSPAIEKEIEKRMKARRK